MAAPRSYAVCRPYSLRHERHHERQQCKTGFDAEFARLERRVEELLITVDALKEENRALRQRQESLAAERSAFAQRNDQVRARVEAMIGRLKTMEHTA